MLFKFRIGEDKFCFLCIFFLWLVKFLFWVLKKFKKVVRIGEDKMGRNYVIKLIMYVYVVGSVSKGGDLLLEIKGNLW